jgi:hypothetical protein
VTGPGSRRLAARFAAYSGFRHSGLDTYGAARELGVSDRTRGRYERAYSEANGPRSPMKASNPLATGTITMTTFGPEDGSR